MSETSVRTAGDYPPSREVGFAEAVKLFFKNYVDFKGRSSRGAYWWWALANALFTIGIGVLDGAIVGFDATFDPLGSIYSLLTFIPSIALTVRRLHDVGRSGWWLLLVFTIIGILVILFWSVQAGDRETNKFGPDAEAGKSNADQIAATFS